MAELIRNWTIQNKCSNVKSILGHRPPLSAGVWCFIFTLVGGTYWREESWCKLQTLLTHSVHHNLPDRLKTWEEHTHTHTHTHTHRYLISFKQDQSVRSTLKFKCYSLALTTNSKAVSHSKWTCISTALFQSTAHSKHFTTPVTSAHPHTYSNTDSSGCHASCQLLVRSNLGFSILHRDASTCSRESNHWQLSDNLL